MRTQPARGARTDMLSEAFDGYIDEMQRAIAGIPRETVLLTAIQLYQAWEHRKQVFVLGNGGSASTASHIANDLSKATIVSGQPRMKVLGLADNVALMTAWANDTSYDAIFKEQLENLLEPGDTVLAISASGNSPNVLRALEFARERGAATIGWTGASGGRMKSIVDVCVHAPTDDVGMIESVHVVIDHLVTRQLHQLIHNRRATRPARRPEETAIAGVPAPPPLPVRILDTPQFSGLPRRAGSRARLRTAPRTSS